MIPSEPEARQVQSGLIGENIKQLAQILFYRIIIIKYA